MSAEIISLGKLLMVHSQTGIAQMEQAGWVVESNGYNTYFRHKETRAVIGFPWWVKQLIQRADSGAYARAQQEMRQAIGIEGKPEVIAITPQPRSKPRKKSKTPTDSNAQTHTEIERREG